MSASRIVRFQGALIRDHHCLLIHYQPRRGSPFWLFPGGGREAGESEEECVAREMREETCVDVEVGSRLFEHPMSLAHVSYERLLTYHCTILTGEPRPGFEPEVPGAPRGTIAAVSWFSLQSNEQWPGAEEWLPETRAQLEKVVQVLGYGAPQ